MLFTDRTSLLQFALTHCPISEIKRILQILHTVETEHLYQQCTTASSSDTVSRGGVISDTVSRGGVISDTVSRGGVIVTQ